MTEATEYFMAESRHVLSDRLARFLAAQLPGPGQEKALARRLAVSPRTARNCLAGHWPGAQVWREIVRQFGRDVLAAVFDPDIDDVLARQRAQIRKLEEALAHRKAALRAVAGGADGLAEISDRQLPGHAAPDLAAIKEEGQ